jgi:hypothetical protein
MSSFHAMTASFAHSISPHIQWSEDELREHASPGQSLVKDLVDGATNIINNVTLSQVAKTIWPGEGKEAPPGAFNITTVLGKAAKTIVAALDVPSTAQEGYSGSTTSLGSSSTSTTTTTSAPHLTSDQPGLDPSQVGYNLVAFVMIFNLINLLNFNSDYFYFNSNYFLINSD